MATNNDGLFHRRFKNTENKPSRIAENEGMLASKSSSGKMETGYPENKLHSGTYWLTRIVFLRSLAFVYFVAFLVALNQNKQLLGLDGLLPIPNFLNHVKNYFGGKFGWSSFEAVPTLLWAVNPEEIDRYLDSFAYCGALLSLFVFYTGCCNMIIMFLLWILYHSLVNVGQRW